MLISRKSAESEGDPLMVMKVWLIVSGIYIWEFITTLDFEWSIIRRHRPYRWTIWIYSISRLSGLVVIILIFLNIYTKSPINCHAWVTSGWAFSALGGHGLGSILIMIRIYAIWDGNKVIMAISSAIWMTNLGFQLAGIINIRADWVPAAQSCAIINVEICKKFYTSRIVTDIVLVSIMLAGLMHLRWGGDGSTFYLSRLLWKQGVIWLAIATAAELPQVILLFLNVNDSLNILFVVPLMAAIIIAATRTYRSLIHSTYTISSSVDTQLGEPKFQKTKPLVSHTIVYSPPKGLEVSVHRTYHEEISMSRTDHYGDGSYRIGAQLANKSPELRLGTVDDVEGGDGQ